jgi:hypothetical protein
MHMAVPQRHKLRNELVKICQMIRKLEWSTSGRKHTRKALLCQMLILSFLETEAGEKQSALLDESDHSPSSDTSIASYNQLLYRA